MKKVAYIPPRIEVIGMAVDRFLMTGSLKVSDTEVEGGLTKGEVWDEEWESEAQ